MPRPTIPELQARARRGEPLVMLTAYDATFARLAEASGIDFLLVGDSVGMTLLGHPSTVPVTMDDMLHHTRAVVRATSQSHVICDLPFLSYHCGEDEAVRNAGRALQDAGAQSVKFEGGARFASFVTRCTDAGIPVMGHIGLRPQQSSLLGGYPAQGRTAEAAERLLDDALALEAAGAWALLLEKMPVEVAAVITERVGIPTIGIGSGPHCSGQVQVMHDVLGLDESFRPRHAGRYADLAAPIREAFARYAADVRGGSFPGDPQSVRGGPGLEGFPAARDGAGKLTGKQHRVSVARPVVVRDVASLRAAIAAAQHGDEARTVGFVPTMGWLHEGHLTLVRRSRAAHAVTVVSVFVNPSQFNNADDLARYPRDEARDVALLAGEGVDIVFAPTAEAMYPPGFATWVSVEGITEVLEGTFRPGHFRGVATVVALLLRMVRPQVAYFGEKDWQQLLVVRRLVRDLHLDVSIVGVPTVREAGGLALSSRNVRLSAEARAGALAIHAALDAVRTAFAAGERNGAVLQAVLQRCLAEEPALMVDYAVVVDADTLHLAPLVEPGARALVAAHVGGVRLIDNAPVG